VRKFQDAIAVVISDQERAGVDILTHGDSTSTKIWRAARGITIRCSWAGFEATIFSRGDDRAVAALSAPAVLNGSTPLALAHVVGRTSIGRSIPKAVAARAGATSKPV